MNLENSATPDISESSTYVILNTITIIDLLNGNPDDIRYFTFGASSIIASNSIIRLQGGLNFTGLIGDTLVLLYDGTNWLEISRSLNPLSVGGDLDSYAYDSGYIIQEINALKNSTSVIQNKLDLINMTAIDITVNLNDDMTQAELQEEIDDISNIISDNADITINFTEGDYILSAPLEIRDFNGDGKLYITSTDDSGFSTSKISVLNSLLNKTALLKVINCSIPIEISAIQGLYSLENLTTYQGGIEIINCAKVDVYSTYIESNEKIGSNIYYENSSGIVYDTYIKNGNQGICSSHMSNVSIENCDDYSIAPNYGIASIKGSIISLWDSEQPDGSIDDTLTSGGGVINA